MQKRINNNVQFNGTPKIEIKLKGVGIVHNNPLDSA
jgi:hypothetical protein